MIKRIVKLTFHPEHIGRFMEIFDSSSPLIRAFPGCRHLELWRCAAPGNVFFTYSIWDGAAALEEYRYSELFRETWSQTKVLFAAPPEAWSLDMVRVV